MAGLAARLESLEGLNEALHSFYNQTDNGFELSVEGMVPETAVDEKVSGLVKNRDKILDELKTLKARYKDVDPEKYAELSAKQDELEAAKLKEQGNWEAREQQLTEKFGQEQKSWQEKEAALHQTIQKLMVDSVAMTELTNAEAIPNRIQLVMPHIKQKVRVSKSDNDEFQVEVVDAAGNVRISPAAGSSSPMTIAELVSEMRESEDFGVCFKAEGATGSGATGAQSGGAGRTAYTREQLTDPATYRKATKDAEAFGGEILIKD